MMKYFPRIRSRNHSLNGLRRRGLSPMPVRSVVRFGSITPTNQIFKNRNTVPIVEINTVESVKTSSSKILMKEAFDRAKVSHPEWFTLRVNGELLDTNGSIVIQEEIPYPLIAKLIYGSRGRGMRFLKNQDALFEFVKNTRNLTHYYMEHYVNMVREYRIHCTDEGCFYTCRKMLHEDASERWYRNNSNCSWILEENPLFDKPSNWKDIEEHCVKALKEVGLDFGAFDVRVQSSSKKNPGFVLIEVNSAPAFGAITEQKYKEILPKLIMKKANA